MYSTSSHCTAETSIINFHQCTTDLYTLDLLTANAVKSVLKVLLQSVQFRIGYTKCRTANQQCVRILKSLHVEKLLQTNQNTTHYGS